MAESAAVDGASAPAGIQMAPIESLRPNPDQPRKIFDRDDLEELAASIREKGVLQPILVRSHPKEDGVWQIIAGERRWRAAQLARLTEAPIIVKEMDDVAVFEVAIIENVQRADLNPLEEAECVGSDGADRTEHLRAAGTGCRGRRAEVAAIRHTLA